MPAQKSYIKCIVEGCGNKKDSNPSLRYFALPHDESRRRKWLNACRIENCSLKKMYICSKHFVLDFPGQKKLSLTAVPKLYLPNSFDSKVPSTSTVYFTVNRILPDEMNSDNTQDEDVKYLYKPAAEKPDFYNNIDYLYKTCRNCEKNSKDLKYYRKRVNDLENQISKLKSQIRTLRKSEKCKNKI